MLRHKKERFAELVRNFHTCSHLRLLQETEYIFFANEVNFPQGQETILHKNQRTHASVYNNCGTNTLQKS